MLACSDDGYNILLMYLLLLTFYDSYSLCVIPPSVFLMCLT